MTRFVDECRREWRRLGVPTSEANEMAADLAADLAEAEAEGVSPEEVLGNGYFDPSEFAASWAMARGFVRPVLRRRGTVTIRIRSLALALGGLLGATVMTLGLAIVVQPRFGAAAAVGSVGRRLARPVPAFGSWQRSFVFPGGAIEPLGWALFGVGIAVLLAIAVIWRPWSPPRGPRAVAPSAETPGFL